MIGGVFLLGIIVYAIYIAAGTGTCGRIERATEWLKWGTQAVKTSAKPWLEDSTLTSINDSGIHARLGFAQFLQRYNDNVGCPWDGAEVQTRPAAAIPPLPPRSAGQ